MIERQYTVKEVATLLRVSPSTVRRLEGTGTLPVAARGHNGYRLYTMSDIEHMKDILYPAQPSQKAS